MALGVLGNLSFWLDLMQHVTKWHPGPAGHWTQGESSVTPWFPSQSIFPSTLQGPVHFLTFVWLWRKVLKLYVRLA